MKFDYDKACREWEWDIPEYFNIAVDCVDRIAESRGSHTCLFWENQAGESKTFTYTEMKSLTDRFGAALRSLGLKKGDRILLRLPNIPEFHIAFLGAMKIGALPIPSSTMFKEKELEYLLNDSGALAVITTNEFAEQIDSVKDVCPELEHVITEGDDNGENHIDFYSLMNTETGNFKFENTKAEDPAFICYTSGTTGEPKGVVHAHRWLIGNDPGVLYWQDVTENDIVAHTSQLNWIFTFSNGFVFAWRQGASTLIYDGPFSPDKWFKLFEKYGVTILVSVPTAYRMLLSDSGAATGHSLGKLRHCISAGEPLTPEVLYDWKKIFGHTIFDGIGMTEHTVYLTNMADMEVKPGSCGKPHPGHPCATLDENGNEAPPGEPGVLSTTKGDPSLFLGYWNKPELTEKAFLGDKHLSGDILYRSDDGYYYFSGRNDDLIMSSGYRISPFDVESAVNSHPAVLESAAVAAPDEVRGVIVKVFAVLRDGIEPSDSRMDEILLFVKDKIAAYKRPRAIEFTPELPKTASGKIKRRLLRENEIRKAGE